MLALLKFLHIFCGTIFFGISVATFFYIARSIQKGDHALIRYSIKTSYFGDGLISVCMACLLASSFPLRVAGNFSLSVPWIFIAYLAFSMLIVLWLINILLKRTLSLTSPAPRVIKSFYALNITMMLIFIIIIHDAVFKNTALAFLWEQ